MAAQESQDGAAPAAAAAPAAPAEPVSWEIQEGDVEILGQVGEGTTATVYMGKLRERVVAVKEVHALQDDNIAVMVQAVRRELRILSRADHPNILKFIGLVEKSVPLQLVLEYCAGGSLFELLHNQWDIPLTWKNQRLKCLMDTAAAADYLHNFDPPIIHRDLKSLNLMLLEAITGPGIAPHVKLADFGLARYHERAMTQGVGTKHWTAPEVLTGTSYTDKADVFSFAMVAYEVVCRRVPFERLDPSSVAKLTRKGKRPDFKSEVTVASEVPPGLLDLIVMCWDQNPEDRPCFSDILRLLRYIESQTPEDPK